MNVVIRPTTDLAPLVGQRVRIVRDTPQRDVRYGTFEAVFHSRLVPHTAGAILLEEPHPGCPGGSTGFTMPYGSRVTSVPTSTPPLRGHVVGGFDGRYRLWTAANGVDFDDVPTYTEGGPHTVPVDGWATSTSSLSTLWSSPDVVAADDGLVTLSIRRATPTDDPPNPLDGTKYPTQRAADRAAYQAGVLAFMVYEKHSARLDAMAA